MAFFASAIDTLKILVIALGAGLGAWGVVNLLEGYGNDNPGAKSQGIKQAYGRRRYRSGWCNADPAAFRPVRLRADLWAVCLNG